MNNKPINQEEAAASLREIEKIMTLTRRIIAQGSISKSLILWGVIWVIGYGATPYVKDFASVIWLGLIAIGWIGAWLISRSNPVPERYGLNEHNWKMGACWVVLFFYAYIWAYLLIGPLPIHHVPISNWSLGDNRTGAYCATIVAFAYVIMGLWFNRFFVWLGSIVTVLALLGYFFLFDYFGIWMAVCGGGSLVVAGVFIQKFWK